MRPEQSQLPVPLDVAMSGIEMLQVSAHEPLQQTCVPEQVVLPHLQTPLTHVEPSPHEWPQAPQLRRSVMRSAQPALGQQVCVIEQGAPDGKQPQWPPMQTVPAVHLALQPPQLFTSMLVLMQVEPQHVPWQFSGWLGQMKPPDPLAMSGPPPPFESLQEMKVKPIASVRNHKRI